MTRGPGHQIFCAVCGTLFSACRSDTLYCGDDCCRQAARQRRRTQQLPPAQVEPPIANGVEQRVWQGTGIQRRNSDGWVNATAMCKANGKHLPHYMANDRTRAYIAALAPVVGIPTTGLVQARQGGTPSLQGTWVHPRLAVDLARWICPAFAVWMDGWLLENLQAPQPKRRRGSAIVIYAESRRAATTIWRETIATELARALNEHYRDHPAHRFTDEAYAIGPAFDVCITS